MKKIVIIESPYAGDTERNTQYARAAMRQVLLEGDVPFASHLLYTQCLADSDPAERALGIEAGLELAKLADETHVFTDLGISSGMEQGIAAAHAAGRKCIIRRVTDWSKQCG